MRAGTSERWIGTAPEMCVSQVGGSRDGFEHGRSITAALALESGVLASAHELGGEIKGELALLLVEFELTTVGVGGHLGVEVGLGVVLANDCLAEVLAITVGELRVDRISATGELFRELGTLAAKLCGALHQMTLQLAWGLLVLSLPVPAALALVATRPMTLLRLRQLHVVHPGH